MIWAQRPCIWLQYCARARISTALCSMRFCLVSNCCACSIYLHQLPLPYAGDSMLAAAAKLIQPACRGFKLLQQMGYREGQGVGASASGRSEPLEVIQKPGRTGLGVDEGRRRRKAEVAAGQQARGTSV